MPSKSKKVLIGYVPVLHTGYINFFKKHRGELYLIGNTLVTQLSKNKKKAYYGRDIRAVSTNEMIKAITALNIFDSVSELTAKDAKEILKNKSEIVAPDEDISRDVVDKYFENKKINAKVNFETVFLRWDRQITEREHIINPDHAVSKNPADLKFIKLAKATANNSPDWWRQIGALAVKGGKVLYGEYNRHMPGAQSLYAYGDPKNNYDVGEGPNYYTSIHAEAAVIARAAEAGTKLSGASLYTSTFPCPTCARLIVVAGIKKIYYAHGHSSLDSEPILKGAGVERIYVPA